MVLEVDLHVFKISCLNDYEMVFHFSIHKFLFSGSLGLGFSRIFRISDQNAFLQKHNYIYTRSGTNSIQSHMIEYIFVLCRALKV